MYTYNFERLYDDEYGWLINNRSQIDEYGNMITLMSLIQHQFPENNFIMKCANNLAEISFEIELSSEDQATLSDLISNYQIIQTR